MRRGTKCGVSRPVSCGWILAAPQDQDLEEHQPGIVVKDEFTPADMSARVPQGHLPRKRRISGNDGASDYDVAPSVDKCVPPLAFTLVVSSTTTGSFPVPSEAVAASE